MRTLVVAGTKMADWAGVEVWKFTKGAWQIDQNWRWSLRSHQHYEVARGRPSTGNPSARLNYSPILDGS
jgi:hypothetical protein